jgi:hypothetical protein
MTEYTFPNIDQASAAAQELNNIGSQRNNGAIVAFREGCRVWIRSKFISSYLCNVLYDLTESF